MGWGEHVTWLMAERGLDVRAAGKSGNRKMAEEAPGPGRGAGSSGRPGHRPGTWEMAPELFAVSRSRSFRSDHRGSPVLGTLLHALRGHSLIVTPPR